MLLLVLVDLFHCYIIWNFINVAKFIYFYPVDRHSGCFHFGAIVNKVGMKINYFEFSIKKTPK